MIRRLYLLGRRDDMSYEQFVKECAVHYDMSHGVPGLQRYEVRLAAEEPTDTHVPYFDLGCLKPFVTVSVKE